MTVSDLRCRYRYATYLGGTFSNPAPAGEWSSWEFTGTNACQNYSITDGSDCYYASTEVVSDSLCIFYPNYTDCPWPYPGYGFSSLPDLPPNPPFPVITSISPSSGSISDTITISGINLWYNFGGSNCNPDIIIDNGVDVANVYPYQYTIVSGTITFTLPTMPLGAVTIKVGHPVSGMYSNSVAFTYV